jgi:hypothetical protein
MKQMILLLIAFLLSNCQTNTKKQKTPNYPIPLNKGEYIVSKPTKHFPCPIKFSALRNIKHLDWTASVVAANGTFGDNSKTGFYGTYNLLDHSRRSTENEELIFAGEITIYKEKNNIPWGSDDTTQQFRHLKINSSILPIWDSLYVGSSKTKLINFLNNQEYSLSDSLVKVILGEYNCEFTLLNNQIKCIEITYQKKIQDKTSY